MAKMTKEQFDAEVRFKVLERTLAWVLDNNITLMAPSPAQTAEIRAGVVAELQKEAAPARASTPGDPDLT
jgi:hypothetical protein